MLKRMLHVLVLIVFFSSFDALVGGGIAAAMQKTGVWNQMVNDFYQLGFAIIIAVILFLLYFALQWKGEVWAVLVLLFGYVEDTLFYLLIPIVNPVIKLISHGAEYRVSGGGMFPASISGWIGWIGRSTGWGVWSLSMPAILVINFFAIVVAMGILIYQTSRSSVME